MSRLEICLNTLRQRLVVHPLVESRIRRPTLLPTKAIVIQIRTATKRAGGSTNNNKNSAGRRLGVKKWENAPVNTGEIILRQRGTKLWPGENAWIGRDHTIYALEPGYVRFYLDPFHEGRKFVGVALKKNLRLPTPHFAPRVRRLGLLPLTDPTEISKEVSRMSSKEYRATPELEQDRKSRDEKRLARRQALGKRAVAQYDLPPSMTDVVGAQVDLERHFRALGSSLEDSRKEALSEYSFELLKLVADRSITSQERDSRLKIYHEALTLREKAGADESPVFKGDQLREYMKRTSSKIQRVISSGALDSVNGQHAVRSLINDPRLPVRFRNSLRRRISQSDTDVQLGFDQETIKKMADKGAVDLIRRYNSKTNSIEYLPGRTKSTTKLGPKEFSHYIQEQAALLKTSKDAEA